MSNSSNSEQDFIDGGTVTELDEVQFENKKHRAETARKMAFLLVWIMALSVGVHFLTTAIFCVSGNTAGTEVIGEIFHAWLPVISGLVSSAATYYFTKEAEQ